MGEIPWAKRERANCNQSKNSRRPEVSRCRALAWGGGSGFNKSDGRQCRPSFLQLLLPKLVKTRKGHMTLRKLGKVSVQAGLGRGAFSQA